MNITKLIILNLIIININTIHAQWWSGQKEIKGNGEFTTETRNITTYNELKVQGELDVFLLKSSENKIKIEGEQNLIPYIEINLKDKNLTLRVKKGYYLTSSRGKALNIYLPYNELTNVTLSGSGTITGEDKIKSDDFTTILSGSGEISLFVEATSIQSVLSGSGDLKLKGGTKDIKTNVSGSGDIHAFELETKNAHISVSGSADVRITVAKYLKARISGSGTVFYKGSPTVDSKISGSGEVIKKQIKTVK